MKQTVTPMDGRHVLWHFGDDLGVEPGGFTRHLMEAISVADDDNLGRLTKGFPVLTCLMVAVKHHPDGLAKVRQLVTDGEEQPLDGLASLVIEAAMRRV